MKPMTLDSTANHFFCTFTLWYRDYCTQENFLSNFQSPENAFYL